ncbi:DUF2244 domain-containing protein [Yoonia sediminilitoris]|uniref:Putative membrane protein n=1 Tax=Yoonia sediminilitoris TaxID=1286148 RepID=A0A2T6KEI8_9RHOB|nr:DUF2244 domain-containing protein [Yoonia sediminilitoris]PUB13544.1 putative membrane protein [Yoonia sediminilitoris]RCW94714.1 putative membrane protein [Yoonia sediminilitoris]
MPYEWTQEPPHDKSHWQLCLWPYRSLLRKDFVLFMGATALIIALPLITLVGTIILWALLPFFALMFWGLWTALNISYRRGEVLEELTVDDTTAHLTRHNPKGPLQEWEANRYWVTVHLHPKGGPVENYLTLRGGDREVELGAFLDAAERLTLYDDLRRALRAD